jgi:hypothetical protein
MKPAEETDKTHLFSADEEAFDYNHESDVPVNIIFALLS